MNPRLSRLALPVLAAGALLLAIFTVTVIRFRAELRQEIRRAIIDRAADLLGPMAERQLAQRQAALAGRPTGTAELLAAVLDSVDQKHMLAVVIFDSAGRVLRVAPESLLFGDLPLNDYLQLLKGKSISRYYPHFPLNRYFAGVGDRGPGSIPVLEVLLPLHAAGAKKILGFAQYYIDGRSLAQELAAIDARVNHQTAATLAIGVLLIAVVIAATYLVLRRAQRTVAERNERLVRANFELALAAKTSALGQITSHLIHGLQGSVAGLRATVSDHGGGGPAPADWQTVANYTERMQAMIQETVALLGDTSTQTRYELTGGELAEIIRKRSQPAAERKGVVMAVDGGFGETLDSHRGSLLCLITSNLVQNAITATDPGRRVAVSLRKTDGHVTVRVTDEGRGIPEDIRDHLFEPGRSSRTGGSGLGLAISRLLALQIDAELDVEATGPNGTTFRLTVPVPA